MFVWNFEKVFMKLCATVSIFFRKHSIMDSIKRWEIIDSALRLVLSFFVFIIAQMKIVKT